MIRIMYRVYRCLERIVLWQGGFQVRMASSEGPETSKREDRRRAQVKDDSESKKEPKNIWTDYKRNFKGAIPPQKTRIRCRRGPERIVNNACPICRNNITVTHTDTRLLEQFISPHTGEILEASETGLCRQQQKKMEAAIEKAWDNGILPYPLPVKPEKESFRAPPWNKIDVV